MNLGVRPSEEQFLDGLIGMGADAAASMDMALADAGVDSFMILEWAVTIEDESGRTLSDELMESLHTVRDLYHFHRVFLNGQVHP